MSLAIATAAAVQFDRTQPDTEVSDFCAAIDGSTSEQPDTIPDLTDTIWKYTFDQTGKIQKVFSTFKIASLSIPEQLCRQLVEIVKNNI